MPGLSASMKCLKYTIFLLNCLFLIASVGLIALGSYVLVQTSEYSPSVHRTWQALPIIIIVLGAIVFLVSFLGCCGAMQENQCMLMLYGICLILILIGQIAAAIMAIVYKDHVEAKLHELFEKGIADYQEEEVAKAIDLIQKTFKCCGGNNSADYSPKPVPNSCDKQFLDIGCVSKLAPLFQKYFLGVIIAISVSLLIQLFVIALVFVLAQQIRNYEPV